MVAGLNPGVVALAVAAATLTACGGSATTPSPVRDPSRVAAAHSSTPASQAAHTAKDEQAGPAKRTAHVAWPNDAPAGRPATLTVGDGSHRVKPQTIDLSNLPVLPEMKPLRYKDAPNRLPPGASPFALKPTNSRSWGAARSGPRSVYVSVAQNGLSRLQLGSPSGQRGGSERVYRRCGSSQHTRGSLTPVRWETFRLVGGETPSYSLHQGWFETVSCDAVEVRREQVRPATIVDGLLYAFISECSDCAHKRQLSLVMPQASDAAVDSIGGKATTTHGSFTVVNMPMRRGGGSAFTATLRRHAITSWARKLGIEAAAGEQVRIGMDVVQAVDEAAPTAIAYAAEHSTVRQARHIPHRPVRVPHKRQRNRKRTLPKGDIFDFR
jgi:hypothetical protein